jgi:hypothetical protein
LLVGIDGSQRSIDQLFGSMMTIRNQAIEAILENEVANDCDNGSH